MKDKNNIKQKIFETGFSLYLENPMQFSVMNIAKKLKIKREQVYVHFPSKNSILRYFYELCFDEYINQTKEIKGYREFSIEEKLGHLVYTHIELFQKEKEFVENTFNESIFRASGNNVFQKSLENQVEKIISSSEGDGTILSGRYLSMFLVKELFHIFKFWIKDDSENSQETIELVDKMISFLGEILSNQIISKGIELSRSLLELNYTRSGLKGLKNLLNTLINRFA